MSRMSIQCVKVDPAKLRAWCKETNVTLTEVSREMGHYDSFMSKVVAAGEFPARQFDLFCRLYNVSPEAFKPDEPVEINTTADHTGKPWSLTLDVHPNKVHVGINYCGSEVYGAWSHVKDNTELGLVQAISYAAHMCYKLAEQKKLQRK